MEFGNGKLTVVNDVEESLQVDKNKKKILWLFVGNRLSHILVVEFGIGPAAAPAQTAQDKLESPITSAFFFYTLKWMALTLWALGPQTCFLYSLQDKWNIIKLGPFSFKSFRLLACVHTD
jgi:hypothetical protein